MRFQSALILRRFSRSTRRAPVRSPDLGSAGGDSFSAGAASAGFSGSSVLATSAFSGSVFSGSGLSSTSSRVSLPSSADASNSINSSVSADAVAALAMVFPALLPCRGGTRRQKGLTGDQPNGNSHPSETAPERQNPGGNGPHRSHSLRGQSVWIAGGSSRFASTVERTRALSQGNFS